MPFILHLLDEYFFLFFFYAFLIRLESFPRAFFLKVFYPKFEECPEEYAYNNLYMCVNGTRVSKKR